MTKQHSTSTQVWVFIAVSSLILLVVSSQLGGRLGLFLGLLFALSFHSLIFIWGDGLMLRKFHLTELKGQDAWGINQKVKNWIKIHKLSLSSKLEIYIVQSELPTAFSFELPWRHPRIVLSDSLLKKLSPEEIDLVLVHQLCQLQHRQTLRFGIMSLLANTLAQACLFLDRAWIPNSVFSRKQKPFLAIFSPLISLLVRMSHSLLDQYAIDSQAAHILGSREKLGRLLWKLEGWSLTHPMNVLPATSHLFIVNPERIRQKNSLLQFHPTTQKRLEKLVGSYPV